MKNNKQNFSPTKSVTVPLLKGSPTIESISFLPIVKRLSAKLFLSHIVQLVWVNNRIVKKNRQIIYFFFWSWGRTGIYSQVWEKGGTWISLITTQPGCVWFTYSGADLQHYNTPLIFSRFCSKDILVLHTIMFTVMQGRLKLWEAFVVLKHNSN